MTLETLVADILTWQGLLAMVTVIAAGIVRGFTGFGSALVMVPVLAIIWSPAAAVTTALGLGFVGSFQLVPKALPQARWRDLGPMAGATLPQALADGVKGRIGPGREEFFLTRESANVPTGQAG